MLPPKITFCIITSLLPIALISFGCSYIFDNDNITFLLCIFGFIIGVASFIASCILKNFMNGSDGTMIAEQFNNNIQNNFFTRWLMCHVWRNHKWVIIKSYCVNDVRYDDKICIFCNVIKKNATKARKRQESFEDKVIKLTKNAKRCYYNKLSKNEQKEVFIDKL